MKSTLPKLMQFLAVAALALPTACAFNSDNNSPAKRDAEDEARQLSNFSIVEGTYVGTLNLANGPVEAELNVFHISQKNGQYSDGTVRYTPVLLASIKRTNPIGTLLTFDARFLAETGTLTLSQSQSGSTGGVGNGSAVSSAGSNNPASIAADIYAIASLNLNLSDKVLSGTVLSLSGPLGDARFELSSKQSTTPKDPSDEIANRYRAEYRAIRGVYKGIADFSDGSHLPIQVKIDVLEGAIGNGKTFPYLVGWYQPQGETGDGFRTLVDVVYRNDVNPRQIKFLSNSKSKYVINIEGIFKAPGEIEATVLDARARDGVVTLKLVP